MTAENDDSPFITLPISQHSPEFFLTKYRVWAKLIFVFEMFSFCKWIDNMRFREIVMELGKVVPGVNTTKDVGVDQISIEGGKFGFDLDANGLPPLISGSLKTRQKREAKNTTNKDATGGQTFYGKNGTPPNRRAPFVESELPEWKVYFHREAKQRSPYVGDVFTIRAATAAAARKEARENLEKRWPKAQGHSWKIVHVQQVDAV